MKSISIKHFKAFGDNPFIVELTPPRNKSFKHLLIYGSNGSGKTSIQEALRYGFHRLVDDDFELVNPLLPLDAKNRAITEVRNNYRNKQGTEPFEIKIDNKDILSDSFLDYKVFFIRHSDIFVKDEIVLLPIIKRCKFPKFNVQKFLTEWGEIIAEDINENLEKYFYESVKVSFDASDQWRCTVTNLQQNVSASRNLNKEFNEAILSLIVLLSLTKIVQLLKESNKEHIIVLDDYVTSLDSINRIATAQYLFRNLAPFSQIILLTHNITYFNLLQYMINNDKNINTNQWEIMNLVKVKGRVSYYSIPYCHRAETLRKDFEKQASPKNYDDIGNKIRQTFEVTLHKLSALMMIGAYEETKGIIARIENTGIVYFKKDGNLQDLILKIDKLSRSSLCSRIPAIKTKMKQIQSLIDPYRFEAHEELQKTINDLTIYQKVLMHPLSHGHHGKTQWDEKEVFQSLDLLEGIEKIMNDINNGKY